MNNVDSVELCVLGDTGDMELASGVGVFLRAAIEDGWVREEQIAGVVILQQPGGD